MSKIDPHTSDLFFNLDHGQNTIKENGKFVEFDQAKLLEEADWFSNAIDAIGGTKYAPQDLVDDFLNRV